MSFSVIPISLPQKQTRHSDKNIYFIVKRIAGRPINYANNIQFANHIYYTWLMEE